MQLWQLGLLVVAGISLVVFLVHATGGSRKAILDNAQAAIARFQSDFPDAKPLSVNMTVDRGAAFLALPDRTIGLVHAMGDCFLTRILTKDDLPKVYANGTELSIQTTDFTYKGGRFVFANEAELQSVYGLIQSSGAANA